MISLIVTVYNKAPFLGRCLDSIVRQNDKRAQVIVVDDGSTDGSSKICDQYKKHGFEVYHTKNMGVSHARNLGIDKAVGDYIAFLDADDLLMPDAFSVMNEIAEHSYNICQYGHFRGRAFDTVNYIPRNSPKGFYDLHYIPRYWVLVWNKLYKKSFLNEHKIRFRKRMQFGEDAIFNAECILANGGLNHAEPAIVIHVLDDKQSLCRGNMTLQKVERLDTELHKLLEAEKDLDKKKWLTQAINEHRNSRLFRRVGFTKRPRGKYDVVYFVKNNVINAELVYSLRSLEENWSYNLVWFCGGCPDSVKPDKLFRIEQRGLNKWEKVRNMIVDVCKNDNITEDFWLFNDDFYILRPISEDMPPQYNKTLVEYADYIERKQGTADDHTCALKKAAEVLRNAGLTTFNYEVHKPMLINRKKALEVLDKFPNVHCFRSLYGNYWQIGGVSQHDMKIKKRNYARMDLVENYWQFLSTSDTSFNEGNVGEFVRGRFNKKSRFENDR